MEDQPYQRVACDFYDSLEAIATFRQQVWIQYRNEVGQRCDLISTIADLQTLKGAEYAHLANGRILRLDQIIEIKEIEWV